MRRFGVAVERAGCRDVSRAGRRALSRVRARSPSKATRRRASYFLAAGALGGGPVRVDRRRPRVDPGRRRVRRRARRAAAPTSASAPTGSRRAPAGRLRGGTIDCVAIPDAAMTLAITALFADAPTTLTDIGSWRVKETDRIAAMATELRKLGATRRGGRRLAASSCRRAAARCRPTIDTYDDHRMAMCFALVAFARRAGDDQRPGLRAQDVSRVLLRRASRAGRRAAALAMTHVMPAAASSRSTARRRRARGRSPPASRARSGFHYLDSGSLYRLVALKALRDGHGARRRAGAGAARRRTRRAPSATARIAAGRRGRDGGHPQRGGFRRRRRRSPSTRASGRRCSTRQRAFRRPPGLVADGRDMGTVVFPGRPAQGLRDRQRRGAGAAAI